MRMTDDDRRQFDADLLDAEQGLHYAMLRDLLKGVAADLATDPDLDDELRDWLWYTGQEYARQMRAIELQGFVSEDGPAWTEYGGPLCQRDREDLRAELLELYRHYRAWDDTCVGPKFWQQRCEPWRRAVERKELLELFSKYRRFFRTGVYST